MVIMIDLCANLFVAVVQSVVVFASVRWRRYETGPLYEIIRLVNNEYCHSHPVVINEVFLWLTYCSVKYNQDTFFS